MTLGGRAAEEVVFGEITTGAANDLEKATSIAKQMIMRYGMSEELGPRTLGHNQDHAVPGPRVQPAARLLAKRWRARSTPRSAASSRRRTSAPRTCCVDHREQLDAIAKILIARETLERDEFEALLDGSPRRRGLPRQGRARSASAPSSRRRARQSASAAHAAQGRPPHREPDQPGDDLTRSTAPSRPQWITPRSSRESA